MEKFRVAVFTFWVFFSIFILSTQAVGMVLSGSPPQIVVGVISFVFSIIPAYVYYDLRMRK